jgi:hypothetical protein
MKMANSKAHLKRLRTLYYMATPRQRFGIAKQRLDNPDSAPNNLIQAVSATEGFARSWAIHILATFKKNKLKWAYDQLEKKGPEFLIENCICPYLKKSPEELFGKKDWDNFQLAIQYRNLLIHEATFLNLAIARPFIKSTETVFNKLGQTLGVASK